MTSQIKADESPLLTDDGFELQMGTNQLGHFALVGHLLPMLNATNGSRMVVVSSVAQRFASIDFDDLMCERRPYKKKMRLYGQSKLANLLFAYELERRLARSGIGTFATAAHPGWTSTNLQRYASLFRALNPFFAMTAEQGALPTLYAATSSDVRCTSGSAGIWTPSIPVLPSGHRANPGFLRHRATTIANASDVRGRHTRCSGAYPSLGPSARRPAPERLGHSTAGLRTRGSDAVLGQTERILSFLRVKSTGTPAKKGCPSTLARRR
jgi:NAD(P)-dependent dehydrogenase (short-subunit alcohol dehydrogenase family)